MKKKENNSKTGQFISLAILFFIFSLLSYFFINKDTMKDLKVGNTYTTESGMTYEVLTLGTGEKPDANDKVEVHYHGTTEDGKVFDSSVERGEKISFGLNQVIAGWTEGLQLMPVGSKFKFTIPANLAYGEAKADICYPKALIDKQRAQIPKEAFVGKDCKFKNPQTGEEEDGEYLKNPNSHPLAGKTLIFDVELFSVEKVDGE